MATPDEAQALSDLARIATALEGINAALLAILDQMRKEPEQSPKVFGLLGNSRK